MTNLHKIFFLFFVLIVSLSVTSCSDGDRGFVPLAKEPEPEAVQELYVTGGAVKGPLINAEISIYKFELNEGPIADFNSALRAWFGLLEENDVTIQSDSYTLGNVPAGTVVNNIRTNIAQYGYTSELKNLKRRLDAEDSFSEAMLLVDTYLDSEESNTKVANSVEDIVDDIATLGELKQKIDKLESLTDKLKEANSFSDAKSLLKKYREKEKDSEKLKGFSLALKELDRLKSASSAYGISSIRKEFKETVFDHFLNSFALQDDPVARQNIITLDEQLDSTSKTHKAKEYIELAFNKEGNKEIKAALSIIKSKITTVSDIKDFVLSHEAFYHDFGLKNVILSQSTLSDIYDGITESFQNNLERAFRDSLMRKDKNNNELNRLSFGVTNEQGFLRDLRIGEYRGFVYLDVKASAQTIDLNTGTKPIFNEMDALFHTDDIFGYGDNSREDRSIYHLLDGVIQRDSKGNLIQDVNLLEDPNTKELISVDPSYTATPLTQLSVSLVIEQFKQLFSLTQDKNLDSIPDNEINNAVLKQSLKEAVATLKESLGVGDIDTVDLLNTPAVRLTHMQYAQEEEMNAIRHRLMIENYASFVYDLIKRTNLSNNQLLPLIAEDLTDGQIDGYAESKAINVLKDIPELQYLVKKSPSERLVPGTQVKVSDVFFLMNEEFTTVLPESVLSLFTTAYTDIDFSAPKGGIDSDDDGILDNDDQFPNDPNKVRDITAGYAGIWSININDSDAVYMPFETPYTYSFNKEVIEGNCINDPCIGVGNLSTAIVDEYALISAPENHDFILTEENDDSRIGFSAFASIPGDYIVRATLTTDVMPLQSYSVLIPIHVLDPKSLKFKFNPTSPSPGKTISVGVKATKGLCQLYPVCSAFDINDGQEHFLDITLFGDVLSLNQRVGRTNTEYSYTEVSTANTSNVHLSNTELNDLLSINVSFSAGDRDYIIGSNTNIIGSALDSDGDTIPDTEDFFLNDAACHLEKDGILDTNFDLVINSLDTPTCFQNLIGQATTTFDVSFLGEAWHYNPSWHYIIRENKYSTGFSGYIKTPTLQGTKESISLFKEDPISKRIYFAYQNGVVDFFSLESQEIQPFITLDIFSSISTLNLVGQYLLVEYIGVNKQTSAKLYNAQGEIADIRNSRLYPSPGSSISPTIDGANILSATSDLLTIGWSLEREDAAHNISKIPFQLSDNNLTLLSGQTSLNDVVKLKFTFDDNGREISFFKNIYVLGIDAIDFQGNSNESNEPLTLNLHRIDDGVLAGGQLGLYVKWYKNDKATTEYDYSLIDRKYPFIYEEINFELGDMIRADVMLKHGQHDLLVNRAEVVILGDINRLQPQLDHDLTVINLSTREASFTLEKPTDNDEYFTPYFFKPIWYINGEEIKGEDQLTFPSISSTNFKYGDIISVSYYYDINSEKGETNATFAGTIDNRSALSVFELDNKVINVGENASLGEEYFSEDELSTLEARWLINGKVDKSIKAFTYPKELLNYGDTIELLIQLKGSNSSGNSLSTFSHVARGFVGVNLDSINTHTTDSDADLDSDGDTVPNHLDYFRYDKQCSLASDGIADDTDNDGISDLDELTATIVTNPSRIDTDADGLSDRYELEVSLTNPTDPDTDGDGYSDGAEVDLSTNPNDSADPVIALPDNDFDGLSNEEELLLGTKVNVFDTDSDGLSDWYEINISHTDPLLVDSDNDKLSDGAEVRVVKSDPNLADTDSDTLSDGVEVALKLDPNSSDTNDNGILDQDESDYDFSVTLPKTLYITDLQHYQNIFTDLALIPNGTCFKTWLADSEEPLVEQTHIKQLGASSYQELAFHSEKWSKVLRYDAQAEHFVPAINIDTNSSAFVSSVEYDSNDSHLIYVGFSDGSIHQFNTQTNTLTQRFISSIPAPVRVIIDQGDYLIIEQLDSSNVIQHSFFDLNAPNKAPISAAQSLYSYAHSIWLNPTKQTLLSFDPEFSVSSFVYEQFNFNQTNPILNTTSVDLGVRLEAPLYIENANGNDNLRFGSGHGVNLSNNTLLSDMILPLSIGFEHEGHRVTALSNSSFIEMTTLNDISNDYWKLSSQLAYPELLALLPTGNHLLAITREKSETNNIQFQTVILGDENADGLPDWWQRLSTTPSSSDFNAFQLPNNIVIPDYLDGSPNIDNSINPVLLVDSDGDQICDHWEEALFNTDPQLADSDSDGMSDAQELGLTTSAALDCSVYPQFKMISDPLNADSDKDGLLDSEEFFTHGTDLLNPDTDLDGLSDSQEVNITSTDPLSPNALTRDTDSDGLSDAFELNESKTNHLLSDTDSDGLSDADEVQIYGTNPNLSDSDGDSLSDFDEINTFMTDASNVDTDQDGLSDAEEIDSTKGYVTDPNSSDTDNDGLDDYYETNFEFEYSDILLEFLNSSPSTANPSIKTDPNLADTDGDGICDRWETSSLLSSNPGEADTDGDHLSDAAEYGIYIDPTAPVDCENQPVLSPISKHSTPDTDGDTILDGDEIFILFTDPKDRDSNDNNISDGLEDFDSDRLTNYQEIYETKTDPFNKDSDNNGTSDDLEDLDGDHLINYDEVNIFNTDPLKIDTDGNGFNDDEEIAQGLDPRSEDSDNDGLTDIEEINDYGTDPINPDTDNDGLSDGDEISSRSNPLDPDSDHDFIKDGNDEDPLDHDIDSDGIIDGIETLYLNTSAGEEDSDGDGLPDGYEVWVYAFEYDQESLEMTNRLLQTGTNKNININSKGNLQSWPDPVKLSTLSVDKVVLDLVDVSDSSIIKAKLFIHKYSDPTRLDSDGDNLLDATEFQIESAEGTDYIADTASANGFQPLSLNSDNFKISNPWDKDSNAVIDTDGDGLPDFYEEKYTFTDPLLADTDQNGINDSLENKDMDQLNNLQELLYGSHPKLFEMAKDTDNDGLLDIFETTLLQGYEVDNKDSDNDGIEDGLEDDDQDTLTNLEEIKFQTDPMTKDFGLDSDGDGLSDYQEIEITLTNILSNSGDLSDRNADPDNDGQSNFAELSAGSDPLTANQTNDVLDTDNDGLTDFQEIRMTNTDPNEADTNNDGISDAQSDIDGDGLSNLQEVYLGTDPLVNDSHFLQKNSDADGLVDLYEIKITHTDETLIDTDNDGFSDLDNNRDHDLYTDFQEYLIGTDPDVYNVNPVLTDTDHDGLSDFQEMHFTLTNINSNDSDGNGITDDLEDLDGDGLSNIVEIYSQTSPLVRNIYLDSDGDGLPNIYEQKILGTSPIEVDSDSNGINDGDEDFDSDGITNIQELHLQSDPTVAVDISLVPDSDQDGLSDFSEKYLTLTDPLLKDTDGDGVDDNLEDPDQDSVNNLDEVLAGSDPLRNIPNIDKDSDGLTDYQELRVTFTNSSSEDSDGDGIVDPLEDLDNDHINNITELQYGLNPLVSDSNIFMIDSDDDGLADHIEVLLTGTDPNVSDTNSNGISDAEEVQGVSSGNGNLNGELLTTLQKVLIGADPLEAIAYPIIIDSDQDGLSDFIEKNLTFSNPQRKDTDFNGIPDGKEDYDQDGLTNIIELAMGTNPAVRNRATDSDKDGLTDIQEQLITLTNINQADTDKNGINDGDEDFDSDGINNISELSALRNPFVASLTDDQEDIDGDFYINVLDQNNSDTNVVLKDGDGDTLPDGLEALLLNTNASSNDTDSDGLTDLTELQSWSYREVNSTESCTDTEIRLSNVAGKDYCFTVEYKSYPTIVDSDNDGIADRSIDPQNNAVVIDHFPLDASCYLASDGFVKADQTKQCFSSWMSGFEDIQIIESAEWAQSGTNHANVLLYASGWDNIIRYNLVSKSYESPISVTDDVIDLTFNSANNSVYLVYTNAVVQSYNLVTGVMQTVGDYSVANNEPQQLLQISDSRLLLQMKSDTDALSSQLISISGGSALSTSAEHTLNLSDNVTQCVNAVCNVYGFIKDIDGNNVNIAMLTIDLQSDAILTGIQVSNTLTASDNIEGPIKLSQTKNFINLGSGQILNLDLQDSDTTQDLFIELSGKTYTQYYDFVNIYDHFVGVVDYNSQTNPDNSDTSITHNGTLAKDFASQQVNFNTYLLPPIALEEQILAFLDYTLAPSVDLVYVSKFTGSILIENFGLTDQDGDGMTSIYESVYSLDDTDENDKFSDPDGDGLVNIEEYLYATDPQLTDTDGDGWDDLYEVLNNTNPTDALDF